MNLNEYFEQHKGTGILATADENGLVDIALYAPPVVLDSETLAFVMQEKRSHHNLKSNPRAAFMFITDQPGYQGLRLTLTKQREETNQSLIQKIHAQTPAIYPTRDDAHKYIVVFHVDDRRPLVGDPHHGAPS